MLFTAESREKTYSYTIKNMAVLKQIVKNNQSFETAMFYARPVKVK